MTSVNLHHILARRLLMGVLTAWAILSAVFALFAGTQEWVLTERIGFLRWGGASDEEVAEVRESYFAERGLDRPVSEQYIDWMGSMVRLDWGDSFITGDPVGPMIADALVRTGTYVVPALVFAVVIGLGIGLLSALDTADRKRNMGRISSYLLFAVPGFWIGGLLYSLQYGESIETTPVLYDHVLPILLTTMTLLGGYVSYSRSHALEYLSRDFVKLVRSKGATEWRVGAHVLRNAAIPVLSMLFTEALGLLVLSVFVVEILFGIDGFGLVLFRAVDGRDLPVLLGGTVVLISIGVLGNIIQDIFYTRLDPRVDTGTR